MVFPRKNRCVQFDCGNESQASTASHRRDMVHLAGPQKLTELTAFSGSVLSEVSDTGAEHQITLALPHWANFRAASLSRNTGPLSFLHKTALQIIQKQFFCVTDVLATGYSFPENSCV